MRSTIIGTLILVCTAGIGLGQIKADQKLMEEGRSAAVDDIRSAKQIRGTGGLEVAVPADFNDTDSFGKNVVFLGSLYAGTVFIAPTCTVPDIPPGLASDDICVPKAPGQFITATEFFRPEWEITIPGKSAKNIIYLMLNNTVTIDNGSSAGVLLSGNGFMSYTPIVEVVSDALNDPAAVFPDGTPMNGKFKTNLPGSKFRSLAYSSSQFTQEIDSWASVNGRGLSRVFFRSIGLPEHVIDKFFKKDMTLKFGMRIAQKDAVASGVYSYTFRVLGQ